MKACMNIECSPAELAQHVFDDWSTEQIAEFFGYLGEMAFGEYERRLKIPFNPRNSSEWASGMDSWAMLTAQAITPRGRDYILMIANWIKFLGDGEKRFANPYGNLFSDQQEFGR